MIGAHTLLTSFQVRRVQFPILFTKSLCTRVLNSLQEIASNSNVFFNENIWDHHLHGIKSSACHVGSKRNQGGDDNIFISIQITLPSSLTVRLYWLVSCIPFFWYAHFLQCEVHTHTQYTAPCCLIKCLVFISM